MGNDDRSERSAGPGADLGQTAGFQADSRHPMVVNQELVNAWTLVNPTPLYMEDATAAAMEPGRVVVPEGFQACLIMSLLGQGGLGSVFEVVPLKRAFAAGLLPADKFGGEAIPRRVGVYQYLIDLEVNAIREAVRRHLPSLALKVVHLLGDHPQFTHAVSRFVREGRFLGENPDPCLPHYVDQGERPFPYLLMQLFRGRTLVQILTAQRRTRYHHDTGHLRWVFIRRMVFGIWGTLARLHAAGIAHRDLKPENLMIQELAGGDFAPALLDLGMARDLGDPEATRHTRLTQVAAGLGGTLWYAAPEQWISPQEASKPVDVHALGKVLAEMLHGRQLGTHITPENLPRHVYDVPPPVESHPEVAVGKLNDLIAEMCNPRVPQARPKITEALARFAKIENERLRARGQVGRPGQ